MISPVSVDLFLLSNAIDAAFLSKADPATHPSMVGFMLTSLLAAHWRAQDRNTATLHIYKSRLTNTVAQERVNRKCKLQLTRTVKLYFTNEYMY